MHVSSVLAAVLVIVHFIKALPQAPIDPYLTIGSKCKSFVAREEWSSMTAKARKGYISAVLCLQKLPSKLPAGLVPGALSRYDDFVATHVNNTLNIHLNGKFLSWHRQFVYLYEKALQDECGLEGGQPYWDWSLYLGHPYNLTSSPLFDGSDTSISNNGIYNASVAPIVIGGGAVLPRGTGGGCITAGPFLNHMPSLGPFEFSVVFTGKVPDGWTKANPRCMQRDLSLTVAKRYNNASAIKYLLSTPDIRAFQGNMSGADVNAGVHGGGHYILGGSGVDFFASPNDPAFWFHHSMIDKVWTEWQAIDPPKRTWSLNGTDSIFDPPGATEMTLDYVQNWGYLGGTRETWELLRVGYEGFCYYYK